MITNIKHKGFYFLSMLLLLWSCKSPQSIKSTSKLNVPNNYIENVKVDSAKLINWRSYFKDENLIALIDTALKNNQELNILLQEIAISKNEVRIRKSEYLPFVNLSAGADVDKVARFTRNGALEHNLQIRPGEEFPEPLKNFQIKANSTWEIDIWKKLRNAKKSAMMKYLSTIEAKNFMVSNLVAEIASTYYELISLDNYLSIIDKNISIQQNALNAIKAQKNAAVVTQLAVNRFEAQLLNTQNKQYEIKQKISEKENYLNYLCARFPSKITRSNIELTDFNLPNIAYGLPSQLLENRPDIKKVEYELKAADLNVKSAKANFYPNLAINASSGFQSFNSSLLFKPESMLYTLGSDLIAPVINRNAIKAMYANAKAEQIQTLYNYNQTIINAYVEVRNELSMIDNLNKSIDLKSQEVNMLYNSVDIANSLFYSARADYNEVLLTQREALDSKLELLEIKTHQIYSLIQLYKSLGGGWN